MILPAERFPDTLAVPVILAPVEVTFIVATPPTIMFTLPAETGILTLVEPLEIDAPPPPPLMPVRNAPLPIKKLAARLPLASLNAIVLAVFDALDDAPDSKLAFKLATTEVLATNIGAPEVAVEIN